jgi:hypothetical protein
MRRIWAHLVDDCTSMIVGEFFGFLFDFMIYMYLKKSFFSQQAVQFVYFFNLTSKMSFLT